MSRHVQTVLTNLHWLQGICAPLEQVPHSLIVDLQHGDAALVIRVEGMSHVISHWVSGTNQQ